MLDTYQDIFSDVSHLNWQLPSRKTFPSSFVNKIGQIKSPKSISVLLEKGIWLQKLGKLPQHLHAWVDDKLLEVIEESLYTALTDI